MLLLLLSCFSRVRLCATPQTAAHQSPPSLGLSRQEHWSGLPFPSPMHEKWKVKVKSLSRVLLLVTPWTVACQAPLSTGFSRQEYWSGLSFLSPGDPSDSRIEPVSLMSPVLASGFFTTSTSGKSRFFTWLGLNPLCCYLICLFFVPLCAHLASLKDKIPQNHSALWKTITEACIQWLQRFRLTVFSFCTFKHHSVFLFELFLKRNLLLSLFWFLRVFFLTLVL